MERGWIKIYRKIKEWEWYQDSKIFHLFIHLLITANRKPKKWKGVNVERGQLITGRKQLNIETGISERSIRTCLKKLEKTGEVTIKATNRFTIISMRNYEEYQEKKNTIDQQNDQQVTSKRPASDHKQEVKEVKKGQKITASDDTESFYLSKKKKKLKGDKLEWFEAFWGAFDLKKGKAEAADSWFEIKKMDRELAVLIYKAAQREAIARTKLTNGSTPKWAQGWLSGKRWEDEHHQSHNSTGKSAAEETRKHLEGKL